MAESHVVSGLVAKTIEAYYGDYDVANLRKEKGFRVLREHRVKKGDIYIKGASNSRKTSASYYTPASLSQPLVTGVRRYFFEGSHS